METSETELHRTIIQLKNQLTEYIHANKNLETSLENANLSLGKGEQERKRLIEKLVFMSGLIESQKDLKTNIEYLERTKDSLFIQIKEGKSSMKAAENKVEHLSKLARTNAKNRNQAIYELRRLEKSFNRAIRVIEQQSVNMIHQLDLNTHLQEELNQVRQQLQQLTKQHNALLLKTTASTPIHEPADHHLP